MIVVAIANQKGGTGKSTTAVNLAAGLGRRKKSVLLVDLDPEGHASAWCGVSGEGGVDVADVLLGMDPNEVICRSTLKNVDVLPSVGGLLGIEGALVRKAVPQSLLKRALSKLTRRPDYILIDCPGDVGTLTLNGLVAAEQVLIPVMPHVMDINGLAGLEETISEVREDLNAKLAICGIVVCRVQPTRRIAKEAIEKLKATYDGLVLKTIIQDRIRLAEAPGYAQSIFDYDPRGKSAEEFKLLTSEMMRRVSRRPKRAPKRTVVNG